MTLSSEHLFFMAVFFTFWLILSFFLLCFYSVVNERRECGRYAITVKDIFIGILFLPVTVLFLIGYFIFWLFLEKLGGYNLIDNLSDFLNKPIKFGGKDDK